MKILPAAILLLLFSALPLYANDDSQTAAAYRQSCDNGDARACYELGKLYSFGEGGVPKDDAQTVVFLRKACDGGSMDGCTMLGGMLYIGRGVPQEMDQAVFLFRKACAAGNNLACSMPQH